MEAMRLPTEIVATRSSPPTRRGRIPRRAGATLRLLAPTLLRQAVATAVEAAPAPHAVTAVVEVLRGVMEAEAVRAAPVAPAAALTPAVVEVTRAVEEAVTLAAVEEARTVVEAAIRIGKSASLYCTN